MPHLPEKQMTITIIEEDLSGAEVEAEDITHLIPQLWSILTISKLSSPLQQVRETVACKKRRLLNSSMFLTRGTLMREGVLEVFYLFNYLQL